MSEIPRPEPTEPTPQDNDQVFLDLVGDIFDEHAWMEEEFVAKEKKVEATIEREAQVLKFLSSQIKDIKTLQLLLSLIADHTRTAPTLENFMDIFDEFMSDDQEIDYIKDHDQEIEKIYHLSMTARQIALRRDDEKLYDEESLRKRIGKIKSFMPHEREALAGAIDVFFNEKDVYSERYPEEES